MPTKPPTPQELEMIHLTDTDEDVPLTLRGSTTDPTKTFTGSKVHQHHLKLPGRPLNDCAGDSAHFSGSTSLVFNFMLLRDLVEGPDGTFVSATLQCCICAEAGTQAGTYCVNKKTMKSTGSILYHFWNNHHDWWVETEEMDYSILPHQKKPFLAKPVGVSHRFTSEH
jgi:hypothetical protein